MYTDGKIWLGQSADKNIYLLPQMANRHGLISGATGTGKTITMKVLAESFPPWACRCSLATSRAI